ncbi:MAG TPA: DUF2946 family protein [Oxalicibacterium sp.]|nr:DUF2946 family protein [Oxalicibacterium sp.]
MDTQVELALAKWPNVPHCYGWLALDARGNWRMRDEQAQRDGRLGERIVHASLLAFIKRNYACDAQGCWYFQNGPQRVYVELEAAPYVAHMADGALLLHTGEPLRQLDAIWLSDRGRIWLQDQNRIALLDDRDLQRCLHLLAIEEQAVVEDTLDAWLRSAGIAGKLRWRRDEETILVGYLAEEDVSRRFGFERSPSAVARR